MAELRLNDIQIEPLPHPSEPLALTQRYIASPPLNPPWTLGIYPFLVLYQSLDRGALLSKQTWRTTVLVAYAKISSDCVYKLNLYYIHLPKLGRERRHFDQNTK